MGICGADPETAERVLDRMERSMRPWNHLRCERWRRDGTGLLQFHLHGDAAHPGVAADPDGSVAAMAGELFDRRAASHDHELQPVDDLHFALQQYRLGGWRALRELNGSFALAIREPGDKLLLATDRQVSHPLFYRRLHRGLAFSTRSNVLLAACEEGHCELDVGAVMEFLTLQDVQLARTFIRQVRAVPAGGMLTWNGGEPVARRYWRMRYTEEPGSLEEYAAALAEALRRAAARQSADFDRGAVFLSGGLDSRLTAAALRRPMTAFTVGDWAGPEVRVARRVARRMGWPHVFLRRRAGHYARLLDRAVELTGGMQRFDHCHFLGHLDGIRGNFSAAFVEEPMDVLLKGHYWHRRLDVHGIKVPAPGSAGPAVSDPVETLMRLDVKSTYSSAPWRLFREPWGSLYCEIIRQALRRRITDAGTHCPEAALEHAAGRGSYGRTSSFANLSCLRPDVRARALCLDNEVLELSLRTPARYRATGRLVTLALRRLAPALATVPLARSGLRPDAPERVAWLAQMGAEVAFRLRRACGRFPAHYTRESWPDRGELLRAGALRGRLERTLADESCFPGVLFDRGGMQELYAEHLARKRDHRWLLLCLLTFGTWFRRYAPPSLADPELPAPFSS